MAQMRVRGMLCAPHCEEKKDNGVSQKDRQGNQLYKRYARIIDMDSADNTLFKINIAEEQFTQCKALATEMVTLVAEVGVYNGYTFYKLIEVKKMDPKEAKAA